MLHLESEVLRLERELLEGCYQPGDYRIFTIYEKKPRQICAAPFRDRVVHHALCAATEPVIDACAITDSFACREGKGTHAAILRAQSFAQQGGYFLKLDLRKYFASVDLVTLQSLLRRKFKDRRLLALTEQLIEHLPPGHTPEKGLPIGNLTSQHWANFYLAPLDHFIKEQLRVRRYLRYMDDFVLWEQDKSVLWQHHAAIEQFLAERLQLLLNRQRTMLAPVSEGLSFLGFRIWPRLIRLDGESLRRFRRKYRLRWQLWSDGILDEDRWLASVRSLVGHISHANTCNLRRSFFQQWYFS